MKKVLLFLLNAAIGAGIGILIFALVAGTGGSSDKTRYIINETGTVSSDVEHLRKA